MKIKKIILSSALLCLFPLAVLAKPIDVINNTKATGTGKTNDSPCSSSAGKGGVMSPNGKMQIPQMALDLYCSPNCKVNIYVSNNCSGPIVATIAVDNKKGITGITNNNVDGYVITGSGTTATVSGGPAKSWYDWLLS